jgi:hypothetical protein
LAPRRQPRLRSTSRAIRSAKTESHRMTSAVLSTFRGDLRGQFSAPKHTPQSPRRDLSGLSGDRLVHQPGRCDVLDGDADGLEYSRGTRGWLWLRPSEYLSNFGIDRSLGEDHIA